MSKQSEAKARQGHMKKAPCCGNCTRFSFDTQVQSGQFGSWTKESNFRCGLGGFASGKSCWCKEHDRKAE